MSISLSKGQKISLKKENTNNEELTEVFMGLGWEKKKSGFFGFGESDDIDLDASAVTFNSKGKVIETVYFGNLKNRDRTIVHSGDNLTGAGTRGSDKEVISVTLNKMDKDVKTVIFTVNSYRGQTFEKVEDAFCRLVNKVSGKEIAKFNLTDAGSHTGLIMVKLGRQTDGSWELETLGEKVSGRTTGELIPLMEKLIKG